MKIDDWAGDSIDIYINDLLVKSMTFNSSGNSLCGVDNQNEQISFEQFTLVDDNTTVTVEY